MPEPLELSLGGGERRGVAVAEHDDRDACEEVEVAGSAGVGQPLAVARHEGDVLARVGRQEFVLSQHELVHATTAVRPMCAVMPLPAASAAARSFGTMPPSNAPASSISFARATPIASTTSSST